MNLVRHWAKICLLSIVMVFFLSTQVRAENPVQDISNIAGGTGSVISGAFALPTEIVKGGVSSFPFGIIAGAIRGTFMTVGSVVSGVFSIAKGAAPYAKYAAFI